MEIKKIAVIGAGTMGHSIAQVFATAGFPVTLTDRDPSRLDWARRQIQVNLETLVAHEFLMAEEAQIIPQRITPIATVPAAVHQADFVVEAVFEEMKIKHRVLRAVEAHCPSHTLIASNSSSFQVDDMATVLEQPARFLVTHFWNPPHLVPLVEVVRGAQTATSTIEITLALLKQAGKYPALVQKGVPGFVGNRLQHALRREAIAIVEQGIASPEDVDLIARLSFGLRMPFVGPLEIADLGGLDLTLAIQSYLLPSLDRSTEPLRLIREKVARGELGAKAGKGFFDWPPGRHAEVIRRRDQALLVLIKWLRENGYLDIP